MRRSFPTVLLLVLLLAVGGCKKKQKATPSTAAQAPTITAQAAPPAETKPEPAPATPADLPPANPGPVKPKPKPKPKAVRKPAPPKSDSARAENPTVAKATPPRVVVQPGNTSTSESAGAVVLDMPHTEGAHHRFTTEQLMQSTDANVKSLKRVLTADERAILQQVQAFMTQAREAIQTNDLVRAHNLALKAHLLSDELVR